MIEIPIPARPRNEGAYSTEAYAADSVAQAEEVEALTGNPGWRAPDTNMQLGGGLPQGHQLRFWKGPVCIFCDRSAEPTPEGWSEYCWIHGGPKGEDEAESCPALAWVILLLVFATAILGFMWMWFPGMRP